MSNSDPTPPTSIPSTPAGSSFSAKNVLIVAIPLCLILGGIGGWLYFNAEKESKQKSSVGGSIKSSMDVPTKLEAGFADEDSDLVADAPKDESKWLNPDELVFATLGRDTEREGRIWKDFLIHLEAKTGKKTRIVSGSFINRDQLETLKEGKIHLVQLSTGNVPSAVNVGGFVPVCVTADDEGKFQYQVEIIVPAKSSATSLKDLRGKTIGLTNFRSHSGFKYPLVKLWSELNMLPERDFEWSYTGNYDIGMERIHENTLDALAVPNDYLKRYLSDPGTPKEPKEVKEVKEVKEAKEPSDEEEQPKPKPKPKARLKEGEFKSIFTSESFPSASFGYVHQLKPELAKKIREAFLTFSIKGSSLEAEYAATKQTKFLEINYKTHWESIRKVDDLMMKFVKEAP